MEWLKLGESEPRTIFQFLSKSHLELQNPVISFVVLKGSENSGSCKLDLKLILPTP